MDIDAHVSNVDIVPNSKQLLNLLLKHGTKDDLGACKCIKVQSRLYKLKCVAKSKEKYIKQLCMSV